MLFLAVPWYHFSPWKRLFGFDLHPLTPMIDSLVIGILLGLSAGLAPGPLLTLVISQTPKQGAKEGFRVALAPFVTDMPIVFIALFVLTRLANSNLILGIISFLGSLFIWYLYYESLKTKPLQIEVDGRDAKSLKKGVLANALNPHPYLFWCGVGAPTMVKAQQENSFGAIAFLAGFYLLLAGTKVITSLLVSSSITFLAGNLYLYTM